MWIGWQGPLGLLALLHYGLDLSGSLHYGTMALLHYGNFTLFTIALWPGLVGQFALWHLGTMAKACWAVRTITLWHLGHLGSSHRGRQGASPPPPVQTFSPRTVQPALPKFTKRGEKLKTGAQLTETSAQHGTTEVVSKRAPGVGSVVLEEHLEGCSPCRL